MLVGIRCFKQGATPSLLSEDDSMGPPIPCQEAAKASLPVMAGVDINPHVLHILVFFCKGWIIIVSIERPSSPGRPKLLTHNESGQERENMEKELNQKTLSTKDGKEGRSAYVCYENRVVDVTDSPLWPNGLHMGRHAAGNDLTADFSAAPHGTEVLDRYPTVGKLSKEAVIENHLPPFLATFLYRHPFFRRHPHPATVHFPIVLASSTSFFSLLHAITGLASFDQTSFYCLVGSLVFTPVAIVTGLLTWWVNYLGRRLFAVTVKQIFSFGLMVLLLILLPWKLINPGLTSSFSGTGLLYLVLMVTLGPMALIVSYYGGTLTFPLEKK
jgi:predicted heme/steroid binding protein/uncharacterized membrane protein